MAIKAEVDANEAAFVAAHAAGQPADAATATDLAEAHRQLLCRWFYDCSPQMHDALAELYVSDARFAAHCDQRALGRARYVHDAIVANAERAR